MQTTYNVRVNLARHLADANSAYDTIQKAGHIKGVGDLKSVEHIQRAIGKNISGLKGKENARRSGIMRAINKIIDYKYPEVKKKNQLNELQRVYL